MRGLTAKGSIQMLVEAGRPDRLLVATCPANGTVPREAPLITASGEGFIYHSTRLHLAHFLPLTLHTAHAQRNTTASAHIPHCQHSRDKNKVCRPCDPSRSTRPFSPTRALPSTKGSWFHPYHRRTLPATLRVPLALSHRRTWPGPPMPSSASSLGHGPADSCRAL